MTPLDGNHHVTGITADVRANLDFWCRILGLRFVKKTLNFETTYRYHPYYGNGAGDPGSVVTFLEFNDLSPARPGRGNIAAAVLRVGSREALDFWMERLAREQVFSEMHRLDPTQPTRLTFEDREGHAVELMVSDAPDQPQAAPASDIPEPFRIQGIEGPRSFADPEDIWPFASHLGFERGDRRFELRGPTRTARWYFAPPPDRPFQEMAVGVWHHIAFDAGDELPAWREHAASGPVPFTPVYDHYFFDSCYSPSPGGLVELASRGPGFLLDQTLDELGHGLALSPVVEPLRGRLEQELTPMDNPRGPDGTLRSAGEPMTSAEVTAKAKRAPVASPTGGASALADAVVDG